MNPKAVIFDVGGVLVESPFLAVISWAEDWDIPFDLLIKIFGQYSQSASHDQKPPLWHDVECGRLALSEFMSEMRKIFVNDLPPEHKARGIETSDFDLFARTNPVDVMIDLSDEVRASGIDTAILTNNIREWSHWRAKVPVDSFDVVVDSCEVGVRKPDQEINLLACERLNLSPVDCLFLDDHIENVAAAKAMGMDAILVTEDVNAAASSVRDRF